MLDSFIIDRIRRERDRKRERAYQPLRIERPRPPEPKKPEAPPAPDSPRGSTTINFEL